ncbi:MAG: hypothetical protein Alpg2KO_09480 [Alphaproteobacteria bacterium]
MSKRESYSAGGAAFDAALTDDMAQQFADLSGETTLKALDATIARLGTLDATSSAEDLADVSAILADLATHTETAAAEIDAILKA